MQEKYYLTVDECPLRVWRLCHEGDFTALRKDKKGVKHTKEEDNEAWNTLYNDFIKKIGLSPEFLEYLELIKEKLDAQFDFVESYQATGKRDRFILNKIKMLQAQIEQYQQTGKSGLSMAATLVRLSKMQGYHIKESDISVIEYFELLKIYNDGGTKDQEN